MTSVTYARALREADLVVYRNPGGRDVTNRFSSPAISYSIIPGDDGQVDMLLKTHHPRAIRCSRAELRRKADELIAMVVREKALGKTIMFLLGHCRLHPGQLQEPRRSSTSL